MALASWKVSAAPPAWVRERAAIEMWPGGTVKGWRRNLTDVGIRAVHPIYAGARLAAIELDGVRQELDWRHHSPLDHALHEGVARLQVERQLRPPAVP
jgi:hypothetical protein